MILESILLSFRFGSPFFALLDSCAVRIVALFGVAGIFRQQLARYLGTLAAVNYPLVLTAYRNGTFPVKGMSVSFYAAFAAAALLVFAPRAVKSAS